MDKLQTIYGLVEDRRIEVDSFLLNDTTGSIHKERSLHPRDKREGVNCHSDVSCVGIVM